MGVRGCATISSSPIKVAILLYYFCKSCRNNDYDYSAPMSNRCDGCSWAHQHLGSLKPSLPLRCLTDTTQHNTPATERENSLFDIRQMTRSFFCPQNNFVSYLTPSSIFVPYTTLRWVWHPWTVNCHVKRRFCPRGPHHPSPSSPPLLPPVHVIESMGENGTDIFRPYSIPNSFRGV